MTIERRILGKYGLPDLIILGVMNAYYHPEL